MARHADRKLEVLAASIAGARCTNRELERVAQVADLIDVDAGVTFHHETDLDHWAYLLIEGNVVITQAGDPIAVAPPGTWFPLGPTGSYPRARVALTALRDAQLLVFRWRDLGGLLDDMPMLSPATV